LEPRFLRRHRARKYFVSAGEGSDSRRLVDAAAPKPATGAHGIRGVDADANSWRESMVATMRGEHALHRSRAGYGRRTRLKSDQESITRVVDLFASVLGEQAAQCSVMPPKEICPCLVAQGLGQLGRVNDVAEEKGAASGCGLRSRKIGDLLFDKRNIRRRPKSIEGKCCCIQFQARTLGIALELVTGGKHDPCPGHLIGRV